MEDQNNFIGTDQVVDLSSKAVIVGAAYFGGLRLMGGLSNMTFREKIDAYLVKKNVLEPNPRDIPAIVKPRFPKTTIGLWTEDSGLGPGVPGLGTDDELFGSRVSVEDANRVKINR